MVDHSANAPAPSRGLSAYIYDPKLRGLFFQVLALVLIIAIGWWIFDNTTRNLARAGIASGYGFLDRRAGFDIGQTLIDYSNDSTYARALLVGLLNTLLVAVTGIITATILGFLVGIGRLSSNWLISQICTIFVELFRNLPPLLVIFFWYIGVLATLPQPRNSLELPFNIFLNNRGLAVPRPVWGEGAWTLPAGLAVAVVLIVALTIWSRRRQAATGQRFPLFWTSLGLLLAIPAIAFVAAGLPLSFDYPVAGRFNLAGGTTMPPEFVAIYLALSFYTASFIAEIVRGGILGVSKGQTEAASALGLKAKHTTRLVVVPQAMRIIIPPLTSQYLNLTKNTSLGLAIGYSDLFATGFTTMNQTGQAIEVISIQMAIYLSISVVTSLFMNWYNARMALVER